MNDEPEQDRPEAGGSEEVPPESPPPAEQAEEVPFEEQAAEAPAKKPRSRAWRIACLGFVVLAAVAIFLQLRAQHNYNRTANELNEAWEKAEQEGKGLYRKDLDQFIYGSPSREFNAEKRTEVFTWRGLRTFRLEVQYGSGGFVTSFQAFQPEE
jgi:hypothetical protein